MITSLRASIAVTALAASLGALTVAGTALAQSEPRRAWEGGGHGMPHLPPGNDQLALQMHADMMRAVSDILTKYAARLPDKK